ncbi:MAG: glycoside hydrolase family 13 protein [Clostridiales bacterium]|nr:glycoside hydrolase family 13 protein [Clostridiales bacterium]
MFYIPFNSRKDYHRYPFGAVVSGTEVVFRVVLPRELCCRGVRLIIRRDGEDQKSIPFFWERMEGMGEEWWKLICLAPSPGLYWYRFEYDTDWGSVKINNVGNGVGKISGDGGEWQLTVYSPDFKTPDFIKGGIMYQIFPDRFYYSGEKKNDVPDDRLIRSDWGESPMWQPDRDGKITKYDFFCGDLKGIEKKLDYLASLGVSCIYLNPIFEAHSNHRYDTADYMKLDPLLGSESDLKSLCESADKRGIKIILDGVFNHTGADSLYFNKFGRYGDGGAYNSKESPYYGWFKFTSWPDKYASWWGVDILPETNDGDISFRNFITGENGVIEKWMKCGISGWRLDVADELSDEFISDIRRTVKAQNKDAFLLGEVWEDASNKISYGHRKKYLLGNELDSVMNYPFAEAILSFVKSGNAEVFTDKILNVLENYPKPAVDALMNHIGTHDTVRAINYLAGTGPLERSKWRGKSSMLSIKKRKHGIALMKLASVIQFTLPGIPCVYYGDEAGLEGGQDPFNRACFPWGHENAELLEHYKVLGSIRRCNPCFADGAFIPVSSAMGCVAYIRKTDMNEALIIANRNEHAIDYYMPYGWSDAALLLGEKIIGDAVRIAGTSAAILVK